MTSDSNSVIFGNYSAPQRKYYPPSDVESELEGDISLNDPATSPSSNEAKRLNKLVDIYKNKFNQLKEAYNETEAEKEKIKVKHK